MKITEAELKKIIDEERTELEKISSGAESVYVEMLDKVWADIGVGQSTTALLDALAKSLRLNPSNRKRLDLWCGELEIKFHSEFSPKHQTCRCPISPFRLF